MSATVSRPSKGAEVTAECSTTSLASVSTSAAWSRLLIAAANGWLGSVIGSLLIVLMSPPGSGSSGWAPEYGASRALALAEVEVAGEGPELVRVLADVRTPIGPAVRARVQALAEQEVVLDELVVAVMAEDLGIDIAALRVGADHDPRHPDPIAVPINH